MNRMHHVAILIMLTGCQGPGPVEGLTSDGGITGTGRPDDPIRITQGGVTNGQLANSGLTVAAMAPLVASNRVELGGTLMLSCPTCVMGMGTAGAIAMFTGENVIGSSGIFQDMSGSIGIGTMTPVNALHVRRMDGANIHLDNSGVGGSSWAIMSTSNAYHAGGGKFAIGKTAVDSSLAMLVVDGSGNVGIGATSPELPLHLSVPGGNPGIALERTGQGSGKWSFNVGSYFDLREDSGVGAGQGPSRLFMKAGGFIGIGTTTPSDRLTVTNGNIRAERTNSGDSAGMLIASDGTVDVAPCDRAKQGGMTFIQDGGMNRGHFFGCRGPVTVMGGAKYCWVRLDDQEGTLYPPSPARCTNWP